MLNGELRLTQLISARYITDIKTPNFCFSSTTASPAATKKTEPWKYVPFFWNYIFV